MLWLDASRGICILLVVFGHVYESLAVEGVIASESIGQWSLYAIYTFHVPTLFFLSGLNVVANPIESRTTSAQRIIRHIVIPYLFWSYLQSGLMAVVPGTHLHIGWHELLLILVRPQAQLWFLWSLALYRIAAIFLPSRAFLLLAVLALLASFAGDRIEIGWRSAYYLIFFAAGFALDRVLVAKFVTSNMAWANLVIVVPILTAVVLVSGTLDGLGRYSVSALVPALVGIATVLLASAAMSGSRLLVYLGRRSMTLLVMHVMASGAARILLLASGVNFSAAVISEVVLFAAIAGSLAAAEVLDRLGLSGMLGIEDRGRPKSCVRRHYAG